MLAENKYTMQDLKTMQEWPLERKIQVTQTRIMEFYNHYNGQVTVSFSGGKDSAVLLDLARRCYHDIEAIFIDTGLEYPEVRQLVKETPNVTILKPAMRFDEVVAEYGWCFPTKEVARIIYYARRGMPSAINKLDGLNGDGTPSKWCKSHYVHWKHAMDAPFKFSDKCCDVMKKKPLNTYMKKTGKKQIVGTTAADSARRRQIWLQTGCNNFDGKHPISKPLSFWTQQDILRYIKITKLPIAAIYGEVVEDDKGRLALTGAQHTGCVFCPSGCHLEKESRFKLLSETHPNMYKYCMEELKLGELLDYFNIPRK